MSIDSFAILKQTERVRKLTETRIRVNRIINPLPERNYFELSSDYLVPAMTPEKVNEIMNNVNKQSYSGGITKPFGGGLNENNPQG